MQKTIIYINGLVINIRIQARRMPLFKGVRSINIHLNLFALNVALMGIMEILVIVVIENALMPVIVLMDV